MGNPNIDVGSEGILKYDKPPVGVWQFLEMSSHTSDWIGANSFLEDCGSFIGRLCGVHWAFLDQFLDANARLLKNSEN